MKALKEQADEFVCFCSRMKDRFVDWFVWISVYSSLVLENAL